MSRSLTSRGTVIISTFSLAGPSKCSGLDVVRYSADSLAEQFGSGFDLIFSREETHMTPAGAEQRFVLCEFKKRS